MIYLIISTICFSLSFGLIKSQLTVLPSDLVAFLRLIIAGLIFLPFAKRISLKKCFTVACISIIQFGLMYIFFIRAFKYLQGNEIALFTASTPLIIGLLSVFFNQKPNRIFILSIILSTLGAIIVIWDKTSFSFLIKGVIYIELANFCFALGQLLWKKHIGGEELRLMSFAYISSAFAILPFAFAYLPALYSFTQYQILSVLYLGIIPTGVGFWLWNKGTKTVSTPTLAVMNNLKIPLGAFVAIFTFKESINVSNFTIGAILILISIIITTYKKV